MELVEEVILFTNNQHYYFCARIKNICKYLIIIRGDHPVNHHTGNGYIKP